MEIFKHGQTVRLLGWGTPSQRQCLWVVDLRGNIEDYGFSVIQIYRQSDPDCIIAPKRERITAATVLDLLTSV